MSPQAAPRDARQQRNSALRRAAGALLGAIVVLVLALALDQEPGGGVGTQTRAPQPQEVRAPPSAQITAAAGEEETVPGVPPLAPTARAHARFFIYLKARCASGAARIPCC